MNIVRHFVLEKWPSARKNCPIGVWDEKGVAKGTEIFGRFGWNAKKRNTFEVFQNFRKFSSRMERTI